MRQIHPVRRRSSAEVADAIARSGLEDTRVICKPLPKVSGGGHYGSLLVFGRDGTLSITMGTQTLVRLVMANARVLRVSPAMIAT